MIKVTVIPTKMIVKVLKDARNQITEYELSHLDYLQYEKAPPQRLPL